MTTGTRMAHRTLHLTSLTSTASQPIFQAAESKYDSEPF